MSKKLSEFLFSFGFIIAGVVLLFVGTISFSSIKFKSLVVVSLPTSHERVEAKEGGDITATSLPVSRPAVPLPKDNSSYTGTITAITALVVDDKSNTVLYKKSIEEVRSLASITKLMSALVLVDLPIDWTTTTIILEDDADSSSHHVNVGEEFTLEDLWHVALIGSSNSAIKSLVRASGLSEEEFVARMNKKAVDIDFSLRFVEPTGLEGGNMGSSLAVARLLKEALKVEKIYRTLQIGEYYARPLNQDKPRRVWSTDWLLTSWIPSIFTPEQIVGKTGYIIESGYNFTVRLSDGHGHVVRVAILGSGSNESRFSEARDLALWAFDNYLWPDDEGYDKLVESP